MRVLENLTLYSLAMLAATGADTEANTGATGGAWTV